MPLKNGKERKMKEVVEKSIDLNGEQSYNNPASSNSKDIIQSVLAEIRRN